MGELTKDTPKPLLKISGKTLLEHNLEALPDEIDEVVLVVGYLGNQIKESIGARFENKKITYVEQKELNGTAHALSACKGFLKDRFLVLYADDLYGKEDLSELIKHPLSVLVSEVLADDLTEIGPATVAVDSKGNLSDILERQPLRAGNLVNTGAYVLNEKIFDYPLISAGNPSTEYGLPQTMMQMVSDGAKFAVIRAGSWRRISTSEDLK